MSSSIPARGLGALCGSDHHLGAPREIQRLTNLGALTQCLLVGLQLLSAAQSARAYSEGNSKFSAVYN